MSSAIALGLAALIVAAVAMAIRRGRKDRERTSDLKSDRIDLFGNRRD